MPQSDCGVFVALLAHLDIERVLFCWCTVRVTIKAVTVPVGDCACIETADLRVTEPESGEQCNYADAVVHPLVRFAASACVAEKQGQKPFLYGRQVACAECFASDGLFDDCSDVLLMRLSFLWVCFGNRDMVDVVSAELFEIRHNNPLDPAWSKYAFDFQQEPIHKLAVEML